MSCCVSAKRGDHSTCQGRIDLKIDYRVGQADGAVQIPGGLSYIGTGRPELPGDGEGPQRRTKIRSFSLDRAAVSSGRFREFSLRSGYVTDAERFGWSFVFFAFLKSPDDWPTQEGAPSWWRRVEGASWQNPEGPGSSIEDRIDHPAIHISWNDAMAFARWAGGRLPTEAEWEYAAKGGSSCSKFPWGDRDPDDGFTPCNIWQGEFPTRNTASDGFVGTAPGMSFEPNAFGLFNMSGNVWEWCSDSFVVRSISRAAKQRNELARTERERVLKGGSYLCHRSYCYRYRIAARTGRSEDTSAGHTGFRVAYD